MWPWEGEPASSATGILDDETYDWACLAEQLSRSGGDAPVASEAQVIEAHRLVHEHTGIDADPTGTASVAALLAVPRIRRIGWWSPSPAPRAAGEGAAGQGAAGQRVQPLKVSIIAVTSPSG